MQFYSMSCHFAFLWYKLSSQQSVVKHCPLTSKTKFDTHTEFHEKLVLYISNFYIFRQQTRRKKPWIEW
jgi:hypothetical protein